MENPFKLTGYCQVVGCMNHVPSTNESPYCGLHMGEGLCMASLLTVHDYEQCLIAQSACNATGIIYSMSELRERIWNTARQHNKGTEWVNTHPILQLYAYQLAHLCHNREPIEWTGYSEAYQFCCNVRDKKITPDHDYTLRI